MANDIFESPGGDATTREESRRERASGATSDVSQRGSGAIGDAREKASEAAHEVRQKTERTLSRQKERATDRFESVSSALRDTSDNLRGQHEESVAGIFESAAEQVDRLSRYVRDRSVGELIDEIEDVARREPALFLGGAALLGIVGARFLKSSERRRMHASDRGRSQFGERREGWRREDWRREDWSAEDWDRENWAREDFAREDWDREDRERMRTRDVSRSRSYERDVDRPAGDLG